MTKKIKHPRIHQLTLKEFEQTFPDENACRDYLVANRWPDGPRCPRCGHLGASAVSTMEYRWVCYQCDTDGYRFSLLVGTIFENTNKPLRQWFQVIHMMLTSKKGMSALQIYRLLGFGSYKTAWSMCHRIRAGMQDEEFQQLMGIVEVDETFVGGKAKNRHKDKRGTGPGAKGGPGPRGPHGKTAVVGAVRRKGNVVARVISNVSSAALTRFVQEAVSRKVSLLCTDQYRGYSGLDGMYPHAVVNHSQGSYVVGAVHTNTIEGFWSLFKRGIMGAYHKVSTKYLPLYVAEFQFRYNNRKNEDIFGAAIRGC